MQTVALFNPFSSKYHALDKFKCLTVSKQIVTVITTLAVGVFTLSIGAVPTFRYLVGRFTKVDLKDSTQSKQISGASSKTSVSTSHIFNTAPVQSTDSIIEEELKASASYRITEKERWFHKALGLPQDTYDFPKIREKVTDRIKKLAISSSKPSGNVKHTIRKELEKAVIEERLALLSGETGEQAKLIAWAKKNLSSVHGMLDCFTELHDRTEKLFEDKKKELIQQAKEATKKHPPLEKYFHDVVVKVIEKLIILKVSNFLTVVPENVEDLATYSKRGIQEGLFKLFDSTEKAGIENYVDALTLDKILHGTVYHWYTKWKDKVITPMAQSNNIGEQSLGLGVCEGISLRLIKQELEDPDYLLKNLESVVRITPKDRFIQSKTMIFKKTEDSDYTQEFLKSIGLRKPSIDEGGFHNEMSLTLRESFDGHYDELMKFCWQSKYMNSGVCRFIIHLSDNGGAHVMYVRHEKETKTFRFFDANIGLVQLDTAEELYQSLGELIQTAYPKLSSFAFARFELSK